MGNWKKNLGFFFLTILIFVKVSSFHVFAHEDEDGFHIENCLVCTMAMDMQQADILQPDIFVFEPESTIVWFDRYFGMDKVFISNQAVTYHFSRPPPALLS